MSLWKKVTIIWELYTSNTSLHGIKYAKETWMPRAGRILWTLFFFGAMGLSGHMAYQVYSKYQSSPVITSLKTVDYKLNEEYFPAVTVCVVHLNAKNLSVAITSPFIQKWDRNSICVQEVLPKILLFVQSLWVHSSQNVRTSYVHDLNQDALTYCNMTAEDLHEFLTRTSVTNVKQSFSWMSLKLEDHNYVTSYRPTKFQSQMILTSHGSSCYTANYQKPSGELLKIKHAGFNTGIKFINCHSKRQDHELLPAKRYHNKQIQVLLHHPYDFPDMFIEKPHPVSMGEVASFSFQVTKVTAMADLRKIAPQNRNCVLKTDKPRIKLLNLTESLANCYSNCMARHMISNCGCLPYYYNGIVKKGIKYQHCNLTAYICLSTVSYEVRNNLSVCGCYTNCNTVRYTTDVWFQVQDDKLPNCTGANVFAKTMNGIEFEIDVRYSWEDLMAAIGGLLGLGLGCSIISFLEFFYFFFCHWWLANERRPTNKIDTNDRNRSHDSRTTDSPVNCKTRY